MDVLSLIVRDEYTALSRPTFRYAQSIAIVIQRSILVYTRFARLVPYFIHPQFRNMPVAPWTNRARSCSISVPLGIKVPVAFPEIIKECLFVNSPVQIRTTTVPGTTIIFKHLMLSIALPALLIGKYHADPDEDPIGISLRLPSLCSYPPGKVNMVIPRIHQIIFDIQ